MRYKSHHTFVSDPDMTPMIDCTFQLVIFFLLTLNFSSDEQSELIHLPTSEIAKPAAGAMETPITVQVLSTGMVLFGGDQLTPDGLRRPLERERDMIKNVLGRNVKNATIIIRADRDVPTGIVARGHPRLPGLLSSRSSCCAKWKQP